jgi:hypothetical protein
VRNTLEIDGVTLILEGNSDEGLLAESLCEVLRQAGFKRAVETQERSRREIVFVAETKPVKER